MNKKIGNNIDTKEVSKFPVLLQVLPSLRSGGVERGTIDIARAAAKAGWISLVVSEGGAMVNQLEAAGATHITLPLETKSRMKMKINAKRLEEIIKEYDVDIVHARSRAPAWSAYWATRKTKTPFITTFHGTYGLRGLFKKRYNSVMTKGDRVIAVSNFIANHIKQNYAITAVEEQKIRVIHRGVDLNVFDPEKITTPRLLEVAGKLNLPDGVPVILLPGRITEWKGQLFLLEALKEMPHRDFYCLMAGDDKRGGAYRKKLDRMINKWKLRNCVRIVDNVQDIAAAYKLSDVVVSASTEPEAFGRVAPEAEAMGRMVIATNHGGACETVIDGKTGWLVEPNNVEQLRDALVEALSMDSDGWKERADNAMRFVRENFSLDKMCNDTLSLYYELLSERRDVMVHKASQQQKSAPQNEALSYADTATIEA